MFLKIRRRFLRIYLLIATIVLLLVIFLLNCRFRTVNHDINYNITDFIYPLNELESFESPRIFLFNSSRPLQPLGLYDQIKCRKSLHIYVSTMLCVYNIEQDIHVSGSIWRNFLIIFIYVFITFNLP
jgi:hypothetical protein